MQAPLPSTAVEPALQARLAPARTQHDEAAILAPVPHIDAFLASRLRSREMAGSLREAIGYSLLSPGKRLRPLLAWWSCVASGGEGQDSLCAGAAVEMIHCFSLIHDDLPALDNDDLRRGVPTLHKHAGEAMAILAGDALVSLAFETLSEEAAGANGAAMCAQLARATTDMITGQVHDTLGLPDSDVSEGNPAGPAGLERVGQIHRRKTGALILAACRMGVLAARVPAQQRTNAMACIEGYAACLGLLFQITDDLIDVTQTADRAGKRTGKDAAAGKTTYPGVLGVPGSRTEVARLAAEAQRWLAPLGPRAAELVELCEQMAVRTK